MPNIVYLIILLNLALKTVAFYTDYCKLSCTNYRNGKWVTDKNSACGCKQPKEYCREWIQNERPFRKLMVDFHNELRNKFALGKDERWPNTVANMHAINYDYHLEVTARCHFGQCNFVHDKCRRTSRFTYVGQNALSTWLIWESEQEYKSWIKQWYDQLDNLKLDGKHSYLIDRFHASVYKTFPKNIKISHFTQFIWGVTTHIGCTRFRDSRRKRFYIACNYGPAGNVNGRPMFRRGKPCSQCGKLGCNRYYKGLCGAVYKIP